MEINVEFIKNHVKKGARIVCIKMQDDPQPVESGAEGTVDHVDDIGTIHVKWDNGRSLGLVPGVNRYALSINR